MNDPRKIPPMDLIDRYLHGTLTPEETTALLQAIEDDPSIATLLYKNILSDAWLNELACEKDDSADYENQSRWFNSEVESPCEVFSTGQNDFFDEILDAANASVSSAPIMMGKETEKTLRRLTGWFWSFRHKSKTDSPDTREKPEKVPRKESQIPFMIRFSLFVLFLVVMVWDGTRVPVETVPEDEKQPLARLVEVIDSKWSKEGFSYKRGSGIDPGRLSLSSGLAKLRFVNGAEIILEGPVDLIINDAMSSFCERGKMSIHIPKTAIGYEILTPFGRFIDRGTDFTLAVGKKSAGLDVIKGMVDVSLGTQEFRKIHKGKAVEVDPTRGVQTRDWSSDHFWSKEKFLSRLQEYTEEKNQVQEMKYRASDRHPNLLCRYDFGTAKNGIISNRALGSIYSLPDASLSGGKQDEGPRSQTQAIRFAKGSDFVTTKIPGSFSSLTMAATVRLDSKRNESSILFYDDNFFDSTNGFLWQLTRSGKLQFHINRSKGSPKEQFDTGDVLYRKDLGTWMTLAVVANRATKTITHYIDGRAVARIPWENPVMLQCGDATIGNLQHQKGWGNNRNFIGVFKDFYFFDRALSDREIADLTDNDI